MQNNLPLISTINRLVNRFHLKSTMVIIFLILLAAAVTFWNPDLHQLSSKSINNAGKPTSITTSGLFSTPTPIPINVNRFYVKHMSTLTAQAAINETPVIIGTLSPEELTDYPSQTNPIIIGAIIIMVVIVGGTFGVIQRKAG